MTVREGHRSPYSPLPSSLSLYLSLSPSPPHPSPLPLSLSLSPCHPLSLPPSLPPFFPLPLPLSPSPLSHSHSHPNPHPLPPKYKSTVLWTPGKPCIPGMPIDWGPTSPGRRLQNRADPQRSTARLESGSLREKVGEGRGGKDKRELRAVEEHWRRNAPQKWTGLKNWLIFMK